MNKKKTMYATLGILVLGLAVLLFLGSKGIVLTGYFFKVAGAGEVNLSIINPEDNEFFNYSENIGLEFEIQNATELDSCWFNFGGVNATNFTIENCTNTTIDVEPNAPINLIVYVNDTDGYEVSESVNFSTDTLIPEINFTNNTAENNSILNQTYIYVEVEVNETNEDTIIFSLSNSSDEINVSISNESLRIINWTNLSFENYTYSIYVNDTYGNFNEVSRIIILGIPPPEPECDENHLSLCDNEDDCEDADGYWYDGECNEDEEEDDDDDEDDTTSNTQTDLIQTPTPLTWENTVVMDQEDFVEIKSITQNLKNKNRIRLKIGGQTHYVGVVKLTSSSATINVSSNPQQEVFNVGDEKKFDVDNDIYYDISVKLNKIENLEANLTLESIHEEIINKTNESSNRVAGTGQAIGDNGSKSKIGWIIFWVLFAVIVIAIGILLFLKFHHDYRLLKIKNFFLRKKSTKVFVNPNNPPDPAGIK